MDCQRLTGRSVDRQKRVVITAVRHVGHGHGIGEHTRAVRQPAFLTSIGNALPGEVLKSPSRSAARAQQLSM